MFTYTNGHKSNNKLFTIIEHTEGEQPASTHKCVIPLNFLWLPLHLNSERPPFNQPALPTPKPSLELEIGKID